MIIEAPVHVVHTIDQSPFDDPRYSYHDIGCYNEDRDGKEEPNELKEKNENPRENDMGYEG